MTYDEAVTAMKAGSKISGRFSDGDYITMDSNGVITLYSDAGNIEGWTPANCDRISADWVEYIS